MRIRVMKAAKELAARAVLSACAVCDAAINKQGGFPTPPQLP